MVKTNLDLVQEKFEKWANDLICDYQTIPRTEHNCVTFSTRIDMLDSSKINLRRIIKEVKEALK